MSFALDIRSLTEKYKSRAEEVTKQVLLEIEKRIVMRSPVGDPEIWRSPPPPGYVGGRFRANWQISTDTPVSGTLESIDPGGNATLQRLAKETTGKPALHYLVNNLPYADRIENGHSTQAPQGVVGLTVIEFQQLVDEAVRVAK